MKEEKLLSFHTSGWYENVCYFCICYDDNNISADFSGENGKY